MAGLALAASLGIETASELPRTPKARTRDRPPSNEELDAIELPDYGLTSAKGKKDHHVRGEDVRNSHDDPDIIAPQTPNELERSQPPTPKQDQATDIVQSWRYPYMNRWRILAACCEYFGNGLNDAAPGALIPYIEKWYGIGYALVSLIWITNAIGFIVAAFTTDAIAARLGRAKSLIFSEACMIAGYVIIACPVPFPAVVAAYLVLGFGNQINLGLNNVYLANLQQPSVILGIAHGTYGVGGIAGPLVATALVSNGVHWQRFYFIPIAIRLICMAAIGYTFWNYEKENAHRLQDNLEQLASRQSRPETEEASKLRLIGRALKIRTTIIGALFIFAYQGAEVSESGWFISYLIDYRNGDPAHVGYVTSGFWAGITLGRFILTHFAHRWGEKWFVTGLSIGVVVFQLLAWLVPNIVGSSGKTDCPYRYDASTDELPSLGVPSGSAARTSLSLCADSLRAVTAGKCTGLRVGLYQRDGKRWRSHRALHDGFGGSVSRDFRPSSNMYCGLRRDADLLGWTAEVEQADRMS